MDWPLTPVLRLPWCLDPITMASKRHCPAATEKCRVLVSQVDPDAAVQDPADRRDCRSATGQPAASLDLIEVYGDCLPGMTWATAAMLSARFRPSPPRGGSRS